MEENQYQANGTVVKFSSPADKVIDGRVKKLSCMFSTDFPVTVLSILVEGIEMANRAHSKPQK